MMGIEKRRDSCNMGVAEVLRTWVLWGLGRHRLRCVKHSPDAIRKGRSDNSGGDVRFLSPVQPAAEVVLGVVSANTCRNDVV